MGMKQKLINSLSALHAQIYKQKLYRKLGFVWCAIFMFFITTSCFNGFWEFYIPSGGETFLALVLLIITLALSGIIVLNKLKYLMFLLIPYVLTFIVIEAGFRVWLISFAQRSERKQYVNQFSSASNLGLETVYVPHHYTLYNLRPFFVTDEGTVHNRLGLRDDRELYPEPDVIRIVFIGGSTTYANSISDNTKVFTYGLERRLNQHYRHQLGKLRIQVINAGMGGATSAENLLRLIFFVSEISPDVIVIQHGLNDVWTRNRGTIQTDFGNYRKSWGHSNPQDDTIGLFTRERSILSAASLHTINKSVFVTFILRRAEIYLPMDRVRDEEGNMSNVQFIGNLVNRSDVKEDADLLQGNGTQYFERNTRYMIAVSKVHEALVVLATEPYVENIIEESRKIAMPQHNALLAAISKKEHVYFYDFYSDMIKDVMYMPDGRHENLAGSEVKQEKYFNYFAKEDIIKKLIRRKLQPN